MCMLGLVVPVCVCISAGAASQDAQMRDTQTGVHARILLMYICLQAISFIGSNAYAFLCMCSQVQIQLQINVKQFLLWDLPQ